MITQVSERVWRGPRPDNFTDLVTRGIKADINLEVGWFEFFHCEVEQEKRRADAAGVFYIHLPIDDLMWPGADKINVILSAMVAAERNGGVYIHCRHGNDRTGIICAAYRVQVQKWPLDKALDEMYAMGFHKFPYEFLGWVRDLKEYLS